MRKDTLNFSIVPFTLTGGNGKCVTLYDDYTAATLAPNEKKATNYYFTLKSLTLDLRCNFSNGDDSSNFKYTINCDENLCAEQHGGKNTSNSVTCKHQKLPTAGISQKISRLEIAYHLRSVSPMRT